MAIFVFITVILLTLLLVSVYINATMSTTNTPEEKWYIKILTIGWVFATIPIAFGLIFTLDKIMSFSAISGVICAALVTVFLIINISVYCAISAIQKTNADDDQQHHNDYFLCSFVFLVMTLVLIIVLVSHYVGYWSLTSV